MHFGICKIISNFLSTLSASALEVEPAKVKRGQSAVNGLLGGEMNSYQLAFEAFRGKKAKRTGSKGADCFIWFYKLSLLFLSTKIWVFHS